MAKKDPLDKLRELIEALPETSEKLSHGSPTWWRGKKTFACFHSGGYDEGRRAAWIKAPEGAQEELIAADPEKFYRPKCLGPSGWVAMRHHALRSAVVPRAEVSAPEPKQLALLSLADMSSSRSPQPCSRLCYVMQLRLGCLG